VFLPVPPSTFFDASGGYTVAGSLNSLSGDHVFMHVRPAACPGGGPPLRPPPAEAGACILSLLRPPHSPRPRTVRCHGGGRSAARRFADAGGEAASKLASSYSAVDCRTSSGQRLRRRGVVS
jgi:hypothetical protein